MVPWALVHRLWLPTPSGHSGGEAKRTDPPQGSHREAIEALGQGISTAPRPQGWRCRSQLSGLMAQVVKMLTSTLQAPAGKNKYASASHGWQTLSWHPMQMTGNSKLNPHLSWRESAGIRVVMGGPRGRNSGILQVSHGLTPVTAAWGWHGEWGLRGSVLMDRMAVSRCGQSICF